MFEIEALLQPVRGADPCGPDLEYDPDFLALERSARGVPEQRMGVAVRPRVAPDWEAVERQASDLFARTKDWRVALLLVRAALHRYRLRGLERGLGLLLALQQQHGSAVHPFDEDRGERFWDYSWPADDSLIVDLRSTRFGTAPDEVSWRDLEWLGEDRQHNPRDLRVDAGLVHRALALEQEREPELDALVSTCRSTTRGLAEALFPWGQPADLVVMLERLLQRLDEALHWLRAGSADDDVPGVPAATDPASSFEPAHHAIVELKTRRLPLARVPPLDLEALLRPASVDPPCGPDLEYDNDMLEFANALHGRPERVYGNTVIAAEPPDWGWIHARAIDLLGRSKDLRFAVPLARAAARANGVAGFVEGLQLIDRLLSTYWPEVHPMPDPDDNDPYARLNALAALSAHEGLLGDLRALEFGDSSRVILGFDIERAHEHIEPGAALAPGDELTLRSVLAAAHERDPALPRRLGDARAALRSIRATLASRLSGFDDPVRDLDRFVERLERSFGAPAPEPEPEPPQAWQPAPALASLVREKFDQICCWLDDSALDLAAECGRARRLQARRFADVARELAPQSGDRIQAFIDDVER